MQVNTPLTSAAATRLLGNGRLHSLITPLGSGYTCYDWVALSRWTPDRLDDCLGYFFYLHDLESHSVWSATPVPAGCADDSAPSVRDPGRYQSMSSFGEIDAVLEIAVVPDQSLELRRIRLTNTGKTPRRIEVTSFLEVVLNHPAADESHPAFSKLFVQTALDEKTGILLAHRRPRSSGETGLWMMHGAVGGEDPQFETDRLKFIGRGHSLSMPQALKPDQRLSDTVGNVLDPIFALRRTVALAPGETSELVFGLGVAETREEAVKLKQSFSTAKKADALFQKAVKKEAALLSELGLTADQADYFQTLAAAILYGSPKLRAPAELLSTADADPAAYERHGMPAWGLHVVALTSRRQDPLISELIKARRYWQIKGVNVSLVIFAEFDDWKVEGEPVFVRSAADMPRRDFQSMLACAEGVILDQWPSADLLPSGLQPRQQPRVPPHNGSKDINTGHLRFFNGYGGFSQDGNEYVIDLRAGHGTALKLPPAPWINTVANETVGFLVSETGAGYTWSRNSREHRLTHWSNDPVLDPHGEALYLRDDETGDFWSPTPGPAPAGNDYQACHGFGYTRFIHQSHGLSQETTLFVPRHDPVKIVCIRFTNNTDRPRKLSAYSYHRLVMGNSPREHGRHIVTEFHELCSSLLATSRRADPFAEGVVFATALADCPHTLHHTGDRAAFLGEPGQVSSPAAIGSPVLDGRTGAGLDACAALQVQIELEPWGEADCFFLIGETTSKGAAMALANRYRTAHAIADASTDVREFWSEITGAVQIETPSPAVDLLINGWLTYQNLACRIWGRSAFYQSGGAYGYRDQLQDSAALVYSRPELTRSQILLHAGHQFVEGDVLHWWHPTPLETGLRTRFSDDLLWLPYITAFYSAATGDFSILDELAPYVTARQLEPGEDENYLKPQTSTETGTVYEHCCRALDRAITVGTGSHGLPLMGTGDWNDGMSRVGREGRGESVWMAFFLVRIIDDFLPLCERRGDSHRLACYQHFRDDLKAAINKEAWDGEWYRRAYYDNGAVMGSKESDECRIDALAQAWSVISGVAPTDRAQSAMDAVERQLIDDEAGIIKLLTPAFVATPNDPGYIKGYVAGVRENGGQYTHAACWVVRAMAELGRGGRALDLLEKIGPVHHALDADKADAYKVEPYVVAADIYGEPPHVGRGGWTWYTGSAGWMFRVTLESILGLRYENGDTLVITPRIPQEWPEFRAALRQPGCGSRYEIVVRNPKQTGSHAVQAKLDGEPLVVDGGIARIKLENDGAIHQVQVTLGAAN